MNKVYTRLVSGFWSLLSSVMKRGRVSDHWKPVQSIDMNCYHLIIENFSNDNVNDKENVKINICGIATILRLSYHVYIPQYAKTRLVSVGLDLTQGIKALKF